MTFQQKFQKFYRCALKLNVNYWAVNKKEFDYFCKKAKAGDKLIMWATLDKNNRFTIEYMINVLRNKGVEVDATQLRYYIRQKTQYFDYNALKPKQRKKHHP